MTIEQAREWLQRHADNTPMTGAREAYKTILEALERTRWIPVEERLPEKQDWYHVVILDTKTKRKVVEQDLFSVELAEKYGHDVGFCKDGRWEGRDRVIMWMPFPEPPEAEQ